MVETTEIEKPLGRAPLLKEQVVSFSKEKTQLSPTFHLKGVWRLSNTDYPPCLLV